MASAMTSKERALVLLALSSATIAAWCTPAFGSPISPSGTLLPPRREAPSPMPSPDVGVRVPGAAAQTVSVGKPSSSPDGRAPSRPTVPVKVLGPCLFKEGVYAPDGAVLEPPAGGYLYATGVVDPNGTVTGVLNFFCTGDGDAPAPPPPPPAAGEVWQVFPLAGGEIGANPGGAGLTGLPTGVWYSGPAANQTVTTNVRGYEVRATARPIRYVWSFGDGEDATSATAGSDDPAAGFNSTTWAVSHVYQNAGDYTLTVAITWSGTYEWSGAGLGGTGNLGAVDITISRTYHVREARGVLAS